MKSTKKELSENEIRPKDLLRGQRRAVQKDIRGLLAHRKNFKIVSCPACGSNNSEKKYKKNGFFYVECKNCSTFYVNPRPTPEIIEEFLENSENYKYWSKYIFPASAETRRNKIFIPRVERVLELCKKYHINTNSILEVGAGYGFFCEEINKNKKFKKVVGVEPSPSLAAACRKKGIEIIESTIEKTAKELKEKFDIIVNFEVIEHLFSPKDFLVACKKLLKPGGLFIVTCPNGKGFDVETLGTISDTVDHEHINYFNPSSLSLLLKKSGFEVLEVLTPGKLDADLVRSKALSGEYDLSKQSFLNTILIDEWEKLGGPFQDFLSNNGLSSNMWLVAQNKK